ncbi:unnamed protein product [Caenorhabditis auriculariae]|uniref:Uncharacterized protein n=1 Tax=Caenorhabditis auriculariae TaxID=2777116 RepID=A0A8S1I0T8_9PELO|nr:unnamed protein product [Caenorhabditis auriculariae]
MGGISFLVNDSVQSAVDSFEIINAQIARRRRAVWTAFNSINKEHPLKDPRLRAHIFEASVIPANSYATKAPSTRVPLLGRPRHSQTGRPLVHENDTLDHEKHRPLPHRVQMDGLRQEHANQAVTG